MTQDFFKAKRPWSKYKDFILGYYLEPYIPKVATLKKPILVVDCFAGCGRFGDGEPGSPLIIAPIIKKWRDKGVPQLTGLFQAGIAAGQWPAGTDPALRARLFTAGLYGLMSQWHTAPGSFCLDAAMAALADAGGAGPGEHRGDTQKKGDGT